jgi:hypothetical protein
MVWIRWRHERRVVYVKTSGAGWPWFAQTMPRFALGVSVTQLITFHDDVEDDEKVRATLIDLIVALRICRILIRTVYLENRDTYVSEDQKSGK